MSYITDLYLRTVHAHLFHSASHLSHSQHIHMCNPLQEYPSLHTTYTSILPSFHTPSTPIPPIPRLAICHTCGPVTPPP
jgi:hypothetical protein